MDKKNFIAGLLVGAGLVLGYQQMNQQNPKHLEDRVIQERKFVENVEQQVSESQRLIDKSFTMVMIPALTEGEYLGYFVIISDRKAFGALSNKHRVLYASDNHVELEPYSPPLARPESGISNWKTMYPQAMKVEDPYVQFYESQAHVPIGKLRPFKK